MEIQQAKSLGKSDTVISKRSFNSQRIGNRKRIGVCNLAYSRIDPSVCEVRFRLELIPLARCRAPRSLEQTSTLFYAFKNRSGWCRYCSRRKSELKRQFVRPNRCSKIGRMGLVSHHAEGLILQKIRVILIKIDESESIRVSNSFLRFVV
jgi:hypothetical protein